MNVKSTHVIKLNNIRDYIIECKGIIDPPTKLLLTNEVAHAMSQMLLAFPVPIIDDCINTATQFIEDEIEANIDKGGKYDKSTKLY